MHDIAFIFSGFLVGLIIGLTGVGGCSLLGIWLGSHLMGRINERVIRSSLSLLLAWAGVKLIAI